MAKGSHATRGGWEPKHCCICAMPVRVTKDPHLRFHFNDYTDRVYAWHVDCGRPDPPAFEEEPCSPPSPT